MTDETGYGKMEGIRNAMDDGALRVPALENRKPEDSVNSRFLKELETEGFFKSLK